MSNVAPSTDSNEEFQKDDQMFRAISSTIWRIQTSTGRKLLPEAGVPASKKGWSKALHMLSFILVQHAEIVACAPIRTELGEMEIAVTMLEDEARVFAISQKQKRKTSNRESSASGSTRKLFLSPPSTTDPLPLPSDGDGFLDLLLNVWPQSWEAYVDTVGRIIAAMIANPQNESALRILRLFVLIFTSHKNYLRFAKPKTNFLDLFVVPKNRGAIFIAHGRFVNFESRYELTKKYVYPYGLRVGASEAAFSDILSTADVANLLSLKDDQEILTLLSNLPARVEASQKKLTFLAYLEAPDIDVNAVLPLETMISLLGCYHELIGTLLTRLKELYESFFAAPARAHAFGDPQKVPTKKKLAKFLRQYKLLYGFFHTALYQSRLLRWFVTVFTAYLVEDEEVTAFVSKGTDQDDLDEEEVASDGEESEDVASEVETELTQLDGDFPKLPTTQQLSSVVRAKWNWFLLSFSTLRYVDALANVLRHQEPHQIQLKIVLARPSDAIMAGWKIVLEDACDLINFEPGSTEISYNEALEVITSLVEHEQRVGGAWLSVFTEFPKRSFTESFTGCVHPEVVLAVIILLQNKPDLDELLAEEDWHVLQELGHLVSNVSASKPCCPACTRILELVADELEEGPRPVRPKLSVLRSHNFMLQAAIPPFMPKKLRKKLIAHFQEELRKMLVDCRSELMKGARGNPISSTGSDHELA
ncbi:hypothetical protein BJ508DRAFT_414867 [Ascobolus immersus RN42]|uniref:Uncharacterized protein n=1 Tax=Ascobolus immersus RN42 TaxID=1160509 RepID=A0A3N4IHR4_ASCIM|nr:hypothetical protein BJ508DRAFT_414867 [Ascobolus immersus RN42]